MTTPRSPCAANDDTYQISVEQYRTFRDQGYLKVKSLVPPPKTSRP